MGWSTTKAGGGEMSKNRQRVETLTVMQPNAAGLDIGAREIWGCIPADRAGETVRTFGTFTPDLHRLADWLVQNSRHYSQ